VVDPLDGTVNYLYGLHDWAVSIAAEVAWAAGGEAGGVAGGEAGRRIVAGAVFVPLRGEMFSAFAGGGAWLQVAGGEPVRLRCGPGVPLREALVGTGFGYLPARRQVQGEVVAALLPRLRDIRRIGVASVDLCAVAAGRLDGFYERGLNYWDWAAGALVASEAGAVVGGLRGAALSSSMAVAAGPALFAPLTEALAELDPERDA
jgi:myo-inositol-1(or 4)-monophosphatase